MASPERSADIEAMFGPHRIVAVSSAVTDEAISSLKPDEAAAAQPMAPGRRAEFATGRSCARMALAAIGIAESSLPRNPNRAPDWPPGVTGSITHTDNWCVAIAARRTGGIDAVGVDAEQIDRLGPAIERRILNDSEQQALAQAPSDARQLRAAVTFAAKEAFYKAHHQIEPRYLGFDAVSVIHLREHRLSFDPASRAADDHVVARAHGRYLTRGGLVVVGVWIEGAELAGR